MAVLGMDVAQARTLARDTQQHCDDVRDVLNRTARRISELSWWGPDADRFKTEHLDGLRQQMQSVMAAAQVLADGADRNAVAQARTSES